MCAMECNPFDDACPTDTACRGTVTGGEVRFTCLFDGDSGLDEVCTSGSGLYCEKGFQCSSSGVEARCYPGCDDAHPCPTGVDCNVWGNDVPGYPGFGVCSYGDQGPADPCTFSTGTNVYNPDARDCGPGLTCVGAGDYGSCATDEDCEAPGLINVDCVDGTCGYAYCSRLDCTDNTECEAEFGVDACCGDTGSMTYCKPPEICGTQGPGDPCEADTGSTVVNPNTGLCEDDLTCVYEYDPYASCTTDAECGGPGVHGCFDGACGTSFCTALGCSTAGDCSAYGANSCCLPIDGMTDMICGPTDACPAVGTQGFDEPCNHNDEVNPTAGDCEQDLHCLPQHANGENIFTMVPCTIDDDCGSGPDDWGCFDGFCGKSHCTRPCDSDAECTTWGPGACCRGTPGQCVGADECTTGTVAAGASCNQPLFGVTGVGDCVPELSCAGYYAPPGSTNPISCTGNAECEATLGAGAVCHEGSCAVTFCSHFCMFNADCEADLGNGACCPAPGHTCYSPEVCTALGL